MSWRALEEAAPEIAGLGRECLERSGVAMLATLRKDGWPRVAPVEAYVVDGRLVVGVMSRSPKARDLARDPRCTVQSVVAEPDSGDPELKLYARVVEADVRPPGAWWSGRPPSDVDVYELEIEQAALIEWDIRRGEMTVRSWSPRRGARVATRAYP